MVIGWCTVRRKCVAAMRGIKIGGMMMRKTIGIWTGVAIDSGTTIVGTMTSLIGDEAGIGMGEEVGIGVGDVLILGNAAAAEVRDETGDETASETRGEATAGIATVGIGTGEIEGTTTEIGAGAEAEGRDDCERRWASQWYPVFTNGLINKRLS